MKFLKASEKALSSKELQIDSRHLVIATSEKRSVTEVNGVNFQSCTRK